MKYIVLFVLIVLIGICKCESDRRRQWKQYKLEFNKTYETNKEEQKRYKIFKQNLDNIQKHNKRFEKGQETYLQEINRFGDLTDQEFGEIYGLAENEYEVEYNETVPKSNSSSDKNEYLDWREQGAVTPAKDQGKCGSCWIFSAVGALESFYFKKNGKLLSLSEQNVVDCYSNDTCEGGIPYLAVEYVQSNGIYLESDYPYTAGQDECKNPPKNRITIDFNTTDYTNGTDNDLKEGVKDGPISVCLYVTARWRFYSSGVWYHNKCSPVSNHCVLLVGYGTENENDYWLFKNSWGPTWGQNGYIKVARNIHENYCGISYGMMIVDNEPTDEENEI